MLQHQILHFAESYLFPVPPGEDPGIEHCSPTDHHPVTTGGPDHGLDIGNAADPTVA